MERPLRVTARFFWHSADDGAGLITGGLGPVAYCAIVWVSCAGLCCWWFHVDFSWWTVCNWTWNFNISIFSHERFFRLSKMSVVLRNNLPSSGLTAYIGSHIHLLFNLGLGPSLLSFWGLWLHAYNIALSKTWKFFNISVEIKCLNFFPLQLTSWRFSRSLEVGNSVLVRLPNIRYASELFIHSVGVFPRGGGEGTPLDGIAFSRLEWLYWGRIF